MTLVVMGQMMGGWSCLGWGRVLGPQRDTWGEEEKGEEAEDRIWVTGNGKTRHARRGGSRSRRTRPGKDGGQHRQRRSRAWWSPDTGDLRYGHFCEHKVRTKSQEVGGCRHSLEEVDSEGGCYWGGRQLWVGCSLRQKGRVPSVLDI